MGGYGWSPSLGRTKRLGIGVHHVDGYIFESKGRHLQAEMMQQMNFAASPSWSASDGSSPRRVTFAKQTQRRQIPQAAVNSTEEPRRQQLHKPPRRAAAKPRRPGWDADVSHGTTLFDSSIKRSLLFQPRAGDRRNEEQAEKQDVAPKIVATVATTKRKKAATRTPVRYRSGPSSVYAQPRQNVTHWPPRRTKDFVRQNIEHLTGRPVDARGRPRSGTRESVFERLSASRVSKALLRSRMLPGQGETERSPAPARSPSASSLSPPRPARAHSPELTIDAPAPQKQASPHAATPSPEERRSRVGWSSPYSSPQRSQQSFSSRPSPAPRSSSTNRSSGGESRYDNYPVRVFGVLDRDNEQRIGVSQILQGLRLLGLPATHNQISDYVYLIHEGQHNSIDLEEWEILVGTLDAASRPSSHSPRSNGFSGPSSAAPSRSPSERSPYSSPLPRRKHSRSQSPKAMNSTRGAPTRRSTASHDEEERYSTTVQREAIVSAERQPVPDDDPYLEEIQNRIEGMFERAQATAALQWVPEPGNNQFENDPDHSRSDRILKRAATVVYSLRASLFPLVHQAEATLREIQQRHGSKLSLFLPPSDMAAIAQNSDVLASAILDDILLDTVQLLNDEDKQQSRRQLEGHHADQLEDILSRIQEIERVEDSMIHQGLALGYDTPGAKCDLPKATARHHDIGQASGQLAQHGSASANVPSLKPPLEVVMNVKLPESTAAQDLTAVGNTTYDGELPNDLELSSQQARVADSPVRTSVLQGKRLQSIERRRHKFQHHRRLVEASLADTGMAQHAVIEILEEMLLDDLVEQTAAELNDTVLAMSDTLLTNLL